MRIVLPIVALIVGLLAGWFGHSMMTAKPEDVASIRMYGDWRLACPQPSAAKSGGCAMIEDVLDSQTRSEIAHLALGKNRAGNLEMIVTMPYDVLLEPGMGLSVGSDKIRVYPYQTCNGGGCMATIPVDDALANSLKNAKTARLLFAALNNKPIGLSFSLNGFDQAYDASSKFGQSSMWSF
jgi:invasion protein IalB